MKEKLIKVFRTIGLGFFEPIIRIATGEDVKGNMKELTNTVFLPIAAIFLFFLSWQGASMYLKKTAQHTKIEVARDQSGDAAALKVEECFKNKGTDCNTSSLPSPSEVKGAAFSLWNDHKSIATKKKDFKESTKEVNKKRKAEGKGKIKYTGRPSFVDQVITSIKTVFAGVLLAFFIAVPIGVILGLNDAFRNAATLLIQIFKPVSPVVWLLLVSMIVTTLLASADVDKSFVISFISVALCSMWATLVNTSVGVSSVDTDYINVAKVLNLGTFKKIFKIILPASLPMIFTGLRITVSVAWMVLIAIELLAQSPGLGTFVWEEFQNGASDSNAKIIVAMFVIGLIGYVLDRIMLSLQKLMTF